MNLERKTGFLAILLFLSVLLLPSPSIFLNSAAIQNQITEYPWPTYLHDPGHTGYTESPAPQLPTVLWSYIIGGFSWGPVIANGKVFICSLNQKIYALNQMTGVKIWEYAAGGEIYASPAVSRGRVFFGSFDGKVYALNESDGAKLWEHAIGAPIISSPTVADGRVFIGSFNGKVYALDEITGAEVWEFTTGGEIIYSSPAVSGDLVFIGSNDGYLYAINRYTGMQAWRFKVSERRGDIGGFPSSPTIYNNKVFIGSLVYNKTYALDLYTGAKIWEYAAKGMIFASPAIAGNKIFILSLTSINPARGKIYALNEANGEKIWENDVNASFTSSPAVADDLIIVSLSNGMLAAFHQSNGSRAWDIALGGVGEAGSSPAVADGKVYVVFGNTLYAIISRSILTISVSTVTVNVTDTVIIWGSLHPAYSNIPIIIEKKEVGEASWRPLATVTTNATGYYIYAWETNRTGAFNLRAIWEGSSFLLPGQSDVKEITVELIPTALTLSLSEGTIRVGDTVEIRGDLSPAKGGLSIVIQWRREGESAWNTLTTVTTNDRGHYSYVWKPDTNGRFELKAYWGGDVYTSASESNVQVLTAEEAPPLITMEQLIAIVAVAAAAVSAILYIKRRPKKPKPAGLRISANPKEIFADGKSTSDITIELIDENGKGILAEKNVNVSLNATDGKLPDSVTIQKGSSSVTAALTSSTNIGTIVVTASARGLKDARTEVVFKEKKRYCMYCGKRMPLEAKTCPNCGNVPPSGVDTKVCRNCGAVIPEIAKFCRECGASQS